MRKKGNKLINKDIYIYCEGSTEVEYIKMLKSKYSRKNVKVNPISLDGANQQGIVQIVSKKISAKKKRSTDFEVYICLDKDSLTPNDLQQIYAEAKREDFGLIYSSTCFEVWILSHFQKVNSIKSQTWLYDEVGRNLGIDHYSNHKGENDYRKFSSKLKDLVNVAYANTSYMGTINNSINFFSQNLYTNAGESIKKIFQTEKL